MIYKNIICFTLSIVLSLLINTRANSTTVSGDNVNIRREPNINSEVIYKLRIGSDVRILKWSGKKEKINDNEGEWVYIDTNRIDLKNMKETIKGWVFSYYLLFDFTKFKRITKLKFKKCIFDYFIGDSYFYYEFFQDGTYISKHKDTYLNKEGGVNKGTLHQYKKLIALQDLVSQAIGVSFYINEDGYLCDTEISEFKEGKEVSACSNCKWE